MSYDELSGVSRESYRRDVEKENQQLKEELDKYRWRDVIKELPDKETKTEVCGEHIWCLVKCSNKGRIARPFNDYHQCWDDEDMDDHYTDAVSGSITHWMPMPEFKEEGK